MACRLGRGNKQKASARLEALRRVMARLCCMAPLSGRRRRRRRRLRRTQGRQTAGFRERGIATPRPMFSPAPTRFQGGEKTDILMPRMPVTHQHRGFRLCVAGTSTPAFPPGQHSPHDQYGGEQNDHPRMIKPSLISGVISGTTPLPGASSMEAKIIGMRHIQSFPSAVSPARHRHPDRRQYLTVASDNARHDDSVEAGPPRARGYTDIAPAR